MREQSTKLDAMMVFCEKSRIPTMRQDSALRKLESLLQHYDKLVKTKNRAIDSCRVMEDMFHGEIENEILDIGHSSALSMMTSEEDKIFYKSQKEDPRESSMGSVDMKLAKMEHRKRQGDELHKERQDTELRRQETAVGTTFLEDTLHRQNHYRNLVLP